MVSVQVSATGQCYVTKAILPVDQQEKLALLNHIFNAKSTQYEMLQVTRMKIEKECSTLKTFGMTRVKPHQNNNKCFTCITSIKNNLSGPQIRCITENYFSYFSTKRYVVCTQKNRLDKTVLLSTQNKCLKWWIRK